MTDITQDKTENKTQAQQDYEAGQDFLNNKDMSQAANAFHNALVGFEQEKNEIGIANASDKLGDICALHNDIVRSLEHYDRAYAICEKNSDRFSLFSIERKKAQIFHKAKEYDKAIKMYLDVLDEFSALVNPQGSVDTLETLAELYLQVGDKSKAADSFRMAASIHNNFKHKKHAAEFIKKAEAAEQA
ncbi:MAG: tetratricopeptide repeat protein [Proteobacteria bacterium]|nr:tetratricopeptide repeat protein [Pseudomonadota bacterium]MBU1717251.1 tetratricopeptide repeat protein [Pseudomonadota bacterium]